MGKRARKRMREGTFEERPRPEDEGGTPAVKPRPRRINVSQVRRVDGLVLQLLKNALTGDADAVSLQVQEVARRNGAGAVTIPLERRCAEAIARLERDGEALTVEALGADMAAAAGLEREELDEDAAVWEVARYLLERGRGANAKSDYLARQSEPLLASLFAAAIVLCRRLGEARGIGATDAADALWGRADLEPRS